MQDLERARGGEESRSDRAGEVEEARHREDGDCPASGRAPRLPGAYRHGSRQADQDVADAGREGEDPRQAVLGGKDEERDAQHPRGVDPQQRGERDRGNEAPNARREGVRQVPGDDGDRDAGADPRHAVGPGLEDVGGGQPSLVEKVL